MSKVKKIVLLFLIVLIAVSIIFLFYLNIKTKNNKKENISIKETSIQIPVNPEFNADSLNWVEVTTEVPWEERDSHGVVVYKNKIWLMGGINANGHVITPGTETSTGEVDYGSATYFNDVWSSEDGINWNLVTENAPWGKRRSIEVIEFNGKMWLIGGWGPKVGYKSDIWSSEDGINWKREISSAAWGAREGQQLVVFQNKIWLIGGVKYGKRHVLPWFFGGITFGENKLFNDVWYSEDGINWKEATKNAGWAPRWDDAVCVFNNKLWMMTGMDLKGNVYKDIWSSENGKDWVLVTDNPPFLSRQGGSAVNYQNKLWIVGRLNSGEYGGGANDVWYSEDGINWKKTKKDPIFNGREDEGIVIFKNKIWVLGGMDKNFIWTNDIWYSVSNIDE